jgi:hypothetical protein
VQSEEIETVVTYNGDTDPRIRIYFVLAFASIVGASFLTDYLKDLASFLTDHLKNLEAVLPFIVAPSIAPIAIFGILLWLFDRYLWKLPLIRSVSGIPDLEGTWKGTLTRTSSADGEQGEPKEHKAECYITQTWRSMGVVFYDFAESEEQGSEEPTTAGCNDVDPSGLLLGVPRLWGTVIFRVGLLKKRLCVREAAWSNITAKRRRVATARTSEEQGSEEPTRIATARTVGLFVKNPQDIHVRYVYGARQTTMLHSLKNVDAMPSEGAAVLRLRDLGKGKKKRLWGTYYSDKMRRGDIKLELEDSGRPREGARPTPKSSSDS